MNEWWLKNRIGILYSENNNNGRVRDCVKHVQNNVIIIIIKESTFHSKSIGSGVKSFFEQ